ncbi:class I SAM-dependent methyltransferase [Patescibacteria group bacterium]|nr:class I SAM-dependent methyltransferase [Patescibacteria group bacterium]
MNPRLSREGLNQLYGNLYKTVYYDDKRRHKEFQYQDYFKKLKHLKKDGPGKLLDFGCNTGVFLKIAQDNCWDVMGIELSYQASQIAKKRLGNDRIITGAIDELKNLDIQFDIISFLNVLEHLPDPNLYIKIASRKLSPGGLLFIVVPNYDSIRRILIGENWSLILLEHINYFTRDSVAYLASNNGLILKQGGPIDYEIFNRGFFEKIKKMFRKNEGSSYSFSYGRDALIKLAFLALITDFAGLAINRGDFIYYVMAKKSL